VTAVIVGEKDLSQAELRVWRGAKIGEQVDFRVGDHDLDLPENGSGWDATRTVRGELLSQVLRGVGLASGIAIRSVWITGARITGDIDLEAATLLCPLTLAECHFDAPIALNQGSAQEISLSGSYLPGLSAGQLVTRGDLELDDGFHVQGGVHLEGAHIGGQLLCSRGSFRSSDGPALAADSLVVEQDMYCDDKFIATGEVRLVGAHIKGQLLCQSGRFENSGGAALNADELTVDGGMFCDGFKAKGEVQLVGAHIGNVLSCTGSRLSNSSGVALNLDRLDAPGHVFCDQGFSALGEVRLIGAKVGGQLNCSGGHFSNSRGPTLSADGLTVGEDVFWTDGFKARGPVSLVGSHIGGQLNCTGGEFINPRGHAIEADGLTVDQDMFCDGQFKAKGGLRMVGAHVGGQFNCSGGHFGNSKGSAIEAAGINVAQEMFCDKGFDAVGEVGLVRAHITQLDCTGGHFANPDGLTLDLEGIQADELLIQPATLRGGLNLTDARVRRYKDDAKTWPPVLRLDGFTYESMEAADPIRVNDRLAWLARNESGYLPQIYDELASYYRRTGLDADAQQVSIVKQRQRRTKQNLAGKVWSVILDRTVGYGYRTWQAGIWLVGMVVVGAALFSQQYPGQLSPVHTGKEQPEFQPVLYTLDLLVPVINIHQRDAWTAHGLAAWLVLAFTLTGWLLTTAFVLSVTGFLKRD